jgi:5-methylcytosine-specific restriction endonuclease McrA
MGRSQFNGGEWTQARFNSFIKSALRAASRRWPPKYKCLNDSFVIKQTNVKTGRLASHYRCNCCKNLFVAADVQVDHINAIIDPSIGFLDWDTVINNMFCESDNLQVLCKPCHSIKTASEKAVAKERKNAK